MIEINDVLKKMTKEDLIVLKEQLNNKKLEESINDRLSALNANLTDMSNVPEEALVFDIDRFEKEKGILFDNDSYKFVKSLLLKLQEEKDVYLENRLQDIKLADVYLNMDGIFIDSLHNRLANSVTNRNSRGIKYKFLNFTTINLDFLVNNSDTEIYREAKNLVGVGVKAAKYMIVDAELAKAVVENVKQKCMKYNK